jgi:adenosylhomocysteine nucleosidase
MSGTRHETRARVGFLVCFAVKEEAAGFKEPLPKVKDGRDMIITGMGRRNASEQFRKALERLSPDRVLTCGFAGALNPKWKIGDVLFDEDYEAGLADKLSGLGALPAKFHCSTRVAVTVAEKAELLRSTGADAVEMESAVIRTLCREQKIPSATIRVISDTASEDLPLDFNALMTSDQKISFPKLALALIRSPQKVPRLMSLQSNTHLAARRLAEVLNGLLHGFGNDGSSVVCR